MFRLMRTSPLMSLGSLFLVVAGIIGCNIFHSRQRPRSPDISRDLSVVVLSVRATTHLNTEYQPYISMLELGLIGSTNNFEYSIPPIIRPHSSDSSSNQIVCVEFQPGAYILKGFSGVQHGGTGSYFTNRFPINGLFQLPARSVTYIGHIDLNITEIARSKLVEFIMIGVPPEYSTSFDISDQSSSDISEFHKQYPHLMKHRVNKAIMSFIK